MASNVSTVDGMGFEEVNQSSYTEMISGNNLYGNNLWISDMAELNIVSGAVFSGGEATFEDLAVNNAFEVEGNRVYSTSIQNATELFGYQVKAGSVAMSAAGYSGLIAFVSEGSFSSADYFITLSARDWTLPVATNEAGSSFAFGISGIRRASGCWAYGPSGGVADWIAVGI